ncbi:MAG: hypothetical protein JSU63_13720 [Phycisphaerales bacterium]|nr:MAG: hypothetical protein JSU63_13720 [Phycisphaerales bacterium]
MQFFFEVTRRRRCTFTCAVAFLLTGPIASGAPGDIVAVVPVPVPSQSGIGTAFEADCQIPPTLYYTNTGSPFLHSMDASGNDLGSVQTTDADTGKIITFGSISWDETRQILWGGTDSLGSPVSVYQIDPATGIATFAFTAETPGLGFADGIFYDISDDTVYVSDDVSTQIDQHDADTGAHLRTFTPTDADGYPLGLISGILGGTGDVLYVSQNPLGSIVQVRKSDGGFIAHVTFSGGRDADLACDKNSFSPVPVIWSKDAYNDAVRAIEVEPGACDCCLRTIPTVSEWGLVILALLLLTASKIYSGAHRPACI